MSAKLTITIPDWLDRICAWPMMRYRQYRYGYPFRKIPLGEGRFTIVDPQDFYRLSFFHWTLDGKKENIYAIRNLISANEKTKIIRMHREIMQAPAGLFVDHRNNNGLDNRRSNLRPATHSQNMQNRGKRKNAGSIFMGVSFDKWTGKWKARIRSDGKKMYLGRFDIEIDAAKAYDEAARKYHKEFARLNFPNEQSTLLSTND
jgi:hypothetical protein